MSRIFLENPINEGYNDVGTIDVDITEFELEQKPEPRTIERAVDYPTTVLFQLKFEEEDSPPVPNTYTINLTASAVDDESFEFSYHPNSDGFFNLDGPLLPIVNIDTAPITKTIRTTIFGPLDERSDECYLRLKHPTLAETYLFTLISDYAVKDEYLCVFDGNSTYYRIYPEIAVDPTISAIYITKTGKVYANESSTLEWELLDTLTFTKLQHPQNLISFEDGFYLVGTSGTQTHEELGTTGPFVDHYITVNNRDPYFINVAIEVLDETETPVTITPASFENIEQGVLNNHLIEIDGTLPEPDDESPTLTALESAASITLSDLKIFLSGKSITTINGVRAAGPIIYIEDFDRENEDLMEQAALLQPYIDLYSVNPNISQNKHIISEGYGSLYKIGSTTKDKFITDVVGTAGINTMKAAQIHEMVFRGQQLFSNVLSGGLADMKLETGSIEEVPLSTFKTNFSSASSSCGCDDCQSSISPFAYLKELVQYSFQHVKLLNASSPSLSDHADMLETKFLQPFNEYKIDCETLHHEFCRVRLVTEVLEAAIPVGAHPQLDIDRAKFLWLVYTNILAKTGTTIRELTVLQNLPDGDEKNVLAQSISNKFNIPLLTSDDELAAPQLWLSPNGSGDTLLNEGNLETLFGFRSTRADVMDPTPISTIEDWQNYNLTEQWKKEDYPFTSYTRETLNTSTPASTVFQDNWKPIIDPDIIGLEDFAYLPMTSAYELYAHRKIETDQFLDFFAFDNSLRSQTAADLAKRILKVSDRNLITHVFEDNEIEIEHPTGPTWTPFTVSAKALNGIDTDIFLLGSTPLVSQTNLFQPNGSTPKMRYKRKLVVNGPLTTPIPNPLIIDFEADVIQDVLSGGYIKLSSFDGTTTTFYDGTTTPSIALTSYTTSTVTLTFTGGSPAAGFESGQLSFVYEVEVPLIVKKGIDPVAFTNKLFFDSGSPYTYAWGYTYLTPSISGTNPFYYKVWVVSNWQGITGTTHYAKLKKLYSLVLNSKATEAQIKIVGEDLHMSLDVFNKFMKLLNACDNFLYSSFTAPEPSRDELYELVSIVRNCAKFKFHEKWVEEEILYTPSGGSAAKIVLNQRYFWKALAEPTVGRWDTGLQTLPASALSTNTRTDYVPIIDPEILDKNAILDRPDAAVYLSLWEYRKQILENQVADFYDPSSNWQTTYGINQFEHIFRFVATGVATTSYASLISPYTDLDEIATHLTGSNVYEKLKAKDKVWYAFRLNEENFLTAYNTKIAFESSDSSKKPAANEIERAYRLLVSAWKRINLYNGASWSWINEEVAGYNYGTFIVPVVKYYNVLKMKLAPGRGNAGERLEWQRTLLSWNRRPFVHPDYVPPENLQDFSGLSWTFQTWNAIRTELLSDFDAIKIYVKPVVGITLGVLITRFKDLLSRTISRAPNSVTLTIDYSTYFLNLITKEEAGEDIRPALEQLCFTPDEYRYLKNMYTMLLTLNDGGANASDPSPLLDEEATDLANIHVHIRSQFKRYEQVWSEFKPAVGSTRIFDETDFRNYRRIPYSTTSNELHEWNKWRSPISDRREWKDLLESRIDRKRAIRENWNKIIEDIEDKTLPFMRDALIRELVEPTESFDLAAERLAKTFFIETKDNCCVKHTRVSFAIETIQGFLFALSNGVYDESLDDFSLHAPHFYNEWKWIGSYASWRAAVFVFIYPENLLHPLLKRKQSYGFRKLVEKLNASSRFSPKDACEAAKEYQGHLDDLRQMQIMYAVSAHTIVPNDTNAEEHCNSVAQKELTFYIGQIFNSGKAFYCFKDINDLTKDALSSWEPIDIEGEFVNLLCCNCFADHKGDRNLYLFFVHKDKGKPIMGFMKKDLTDPYSEWEQNKMNDLPTLNIPQGHELNPAHVVGCHQNTIYGNPAFLISYEHNGVLKWVYTTYDIGTDRFNQFNPNNPLLLASYTNTAFFPQYSQFPWTVVRHNKGVVAIAFEDNILFIRVNSVPSALQPVETSTPWWNPNSFRKIIGVYEEPIDGQIGDTFVVLLRHLIAGTVEKITYTIASTGSVCVTQTNSTAQTDQKIKDIERILPMSVQVGWLGDFFVNTIRNELIGCRLTNDTTTNLVDMTRTFVLRVRTQNPLPVTVLTAEHIDDLQQRKTEIRDNMLANTTVPVNLNIPVNLYQNMNMTVEYLWEAYFHVPLLLALDQQKRGQFTCALEWYRSIYDYTQETGTLRKIFYGLVSEGNFISTYPRYDNWLLDPLNPHLIASTRTNAYTKYVLTNLIQCLYSYADREFTLDTIETVPKARKLYTAALDLLKSSEIRTTPSICFTVSHDQLDDSEPMETARAMPNLYGVLQDELAKLGNQADIETVLPELEALFAGATEAQLGEKFSLAFDEIKEALDNQPEHVPESMGDTFENIGTRTDSAYQYFFANGSASQFYNSVNAQFTSSVAQISGIAVEEALATEVQDRLAWLGEEVPANNSEHGFEFLSPAGEQNFTGARAYNPINPTDVSYSTNSDYSNPQWTLHIHGPRPFIPLTAYNFCIPENPVYKSMELKGQLELFKIFNCRNIAGITRELSVYSAATDSTTGMPFIGASGTLNLPGLTNFVPTQYRFKTLIERAKQICEQAKQMESLFLAAMEKQDAENYNQLQAKQGIETARAQIKLQDLRINQAKSESTLAGLQLEKVSFMRQHFDELISKGLIAYEKESLQLLATSLTWLGSAIAALTAAQNWYTAQGIASSTAAGLSFGSGYYREGFVNTAAALSSAAAVASSQSSGHSIQSSIASIQSSISSQLASYERRTEEWEFQKSLAEQDIKIANQQIKIAEDNLRVVGQEREIAVLNVEHAKDNYEFLRNKFTNAALYNWMGNILEGTYSYMLNLSTSIAKSAESQLYFERQEQAGPFILSDYWETPSAGSIAGSSSGTDRRGLTGSARLMVDITRLEQHALDSFKRKLQMTKAISLANNFPMEFQQFKETGVLNFQLTNKQFDFDFPGHYLRLIHAVKTTVVGLIPVYDGIKASLTCDTISYTVISGTTFQKIPIRKMETDSVALTSTVAATGVFEMQPLQTELLNPFEGTGIESRWEFKMPQFSNHFDFSQIADVILNVDYTALDDFQYRHQVLNELDNQITFNRAFSMKNDFPDQWFDLAEHDTANPTFEVSFGFKRFNFPQAIENLRLNGSIIAYFVREDGYDKEISGVDVLPENTTPTPFVGTNTSDAKLTLNINGNSPVVDLKLILLNNFENQDLFKKGYIKDIIFLVKCKADLKQFPL